MTILRQRPGGTSPCGCPSGFTLLELLVGLAVLSLILVMLFGGVRFATASLGRADQASERLSDLRIAHSFIRRHVAAARPLAVPGDGRGRLAFEGGPSSLGFATVLAPHLGRGAGPHWARLSLDEVASGSGLVFARRPLRGTGSEGGAAAAERSLLLGGVEELRFSYFGVSPPERGPRWHDRWSGETALPRLVRLRLRRSGGAPWPDLVIAPMMTRAER